MATKAHEPIKLSRPLTALEREALNKVHSLPRRKQLLVLNAMKRLFIKTGISSKDGKLINREKLKEMLQMVAEQRKQRTLAQKPSKQ